MKLKKEHVGSSLESWLEAEGLLESTTTAAVKAIIAWQLSQEMKRKKITKKRMAELMQTSRAQLDRILDPSNGSATLETLQRAAAVLGRRLKLKLV